LRDGFRKRDDVTWIHLSEWMSEDGDSQGRPKSIAGEAERRNYVLPNKPPLTMKRILSIGHLDLHNGACRRVAHRNGGTRGRTSMIGPGFAIK
jgi:hypothetical protein